MWRSAYDVTRQVIDDLGEKNASLISAGVAFYGLFAIFPGIAATISLFGLFAIL
jgi:membrane protein